LDSIRVRAGGSHSVKTGGGDDVSGRDTGMGLLPALWRVSHEGLDSSNMYNSLILLISIIINRLVTLPTSFVYIYALD
jgi:hypothetical protein